MADSNSVLRRVVLNVELTDVRVIRWHGELRDYRAGQVNEFEPVFSVDFRSDADSIQFRWDFDSTLSSPTGQPVANIGLSVLQTFALTDANLGALLSPDVMQAFAEKTAVISVIPFVREAVQTMTVRLGLPAVTLGLVRAGTGGPRSFSVRNEDI